MSVDPYYYEQEAAYEAFIEELQDDPAFREEFLDKITVENTFNYLCKYGDEVYRRTEGLISEALELVKIEYYNQALISAIAALEITIKFLILRPILLGGLVDNQFVEILTKRITRASSGEDRKILEKALNIWGLKIDVIKLSNGKGLLDALKEFFDKRHNIVHKGDKVTDNDARIAIELYEKIKHEIVFPIAAKLKIRIKETGEWNKVYDYKGVKVMKVIKPESPFE